MRLEHKGLGVSVELLDELLQRHVEAYFIALRDLTGENAIELSSPERMGHFVRAACRSGILNHIAEDDVADLPPSQVNWLAGKIDDHLAKALDIPPE